MKRDKHLAAAAGVIIAAVCLIVLTWVGTMRSIRLENQDNTRRVTATLANQALTFSEQINRQILAIDQTLRIMVTAWQTNPRAFNLQAWRAQATVLSGLSQDMVLTDENGIIRQSSIAEAISQNASGLDYFRVLAGPPDPDAPVQTEHPADRLYIGPATIDGLMRQWHMNIARALSYPDGSFAGLIDADYRTAAITDVFSETDLGTGGFVALVGLDDGKLRGAVGPASIDPDASVGDTPMFAAIRKTDSGTWIGPSPNDAVRRIHAFRRIPDRDLVVVVAMDEAEALLPATLWRQHAKIFAGCITALLIALALVLVGGGVRARRRGGLITEDRADIAAAKAQLEVARAIATAKAEQLEATLGGMSDGVSMFDSHICLLEWNAKFPDIAGVPADILRVGLPMEDILRAQIQTGQFGAIDDPEAEVDRRMGRLRIARFGVVQRQRPDGRTLELRRNRLPDGGFVTLYSDITEHKRAEDALRQAREAAEAANQEKSRFVAIVSHEIRTPLNGLLNSIRLLSDSVLAPAQRSLLAMARQSGDVLFGLITDILEMSRLEAGKLSIRPSLFELRPLLESCAEMFAGQAAERGMTIRVAIADDAPAMLYTDPARLRQVQLNLVSNAVKYARSGDIWLTAEPDESARDEAGNITSVRLTVQDDGPIIGRAAREMLFKPFSRLDRPDDDASGTGLGLSICHQLVTLMGGRIGCEVWRSDAAEPGEASEGNAFWIMLPIGHADAGAGPARPSDTAGVPAVGHSNVVPLAQPDVAIDRRPFPALPRTRVLLVEDIVANQVVTATLLRREGHLVDVASTGPAAIDMVRSTQYDLIFMDIFMPVMSGQETTQIIRSLPEPARSTAIIALTANIGPEDEQTFKAAGMDGRLGKPVALAELLGALRDHVWFPTRGTIIAAELEPDIIEAPAAKAILSRERIGELRANLPADRFASLIEECLVDMVHRLPALRRALVAGAPAAVTLHAHAIVGMAASYGMSALEATLRGIMAAAREGDVASFGPTAVKTVDSDFNEAARTLRDMLRQEAA